MPLQGKTFIFAQEITSEEDMNGNAIKPFVSGEDKHVGSASFSNLMHFTWDMLLIMCCNKVPVISPCDKGIEKMMAVLTPSYELVLQSKLVSCAPSHYRVEDPEIKRVVYNEEKHYGLIELLMKSYMAVEPTLPEEVEKDIAFMFKKSREKDPDQLDLKPFVEYTCKQDDFIAIQDPLDLIASQGIKSDTMRISYSFHAI